MERMVSIPIHGLIALHHHGRRGRRDHFPALKFDSSSMKTPVSPYPGKLVISASSSPPDKKLPQSAVLAFDAKSSLV